MEKNKKQSDEIYKKIFERVELIKRFADGNTIVKKTTGEDNIKDLITQKIYTDRAAGDATVDAVWEGFPGLPTETVQEKDGNEEEVVMETLLQTLRNCMNVKRSDEDLVITYNTLPSCLGTLTRKIKEMDDQHERLQASATGNFDEILLLTSSLSTIKGIHARLKDDMITLQNGQIASEKGMMMRTTTEIERQAELDYEGSLNPFKPDPNEKFSSAWMKKKEKTHRQKEEICNTIDMNGEGVKAWLLHENGMVIVPRLPMSTECKQVRQNTAAIVYQDRVFSSGPLSGSELGGRKKKTISRYHKRKIKSMKRKNIYHNKKTKKGLKKKKSLKRK